MKIGLTLKRQLTINGKPKVYTGKYLCGTPYENKCIISIIQFIKLLPILKKINRGDDYPYRIHPFTYNGFFGESDNNKFVSYRARFIRWTDDAGIVLMICSNGENKLIPTYAIEGSMLLPEKTNTNEQTVLFGVASKS